MEVHYGFTFPIFIKSTVLSVLFTLICIATSVPQQYIPSNKYITAGLFDIVTTPFTSSNVTNLYSVPFAGYTRSSDYFKVGFSLHSLYIKFNNIKLEFDLEVKKTSMSGFQIQFTSSQANLVSFMKICYITKDPMYTEIFYIDTYRHNGTSFQIGNSSTSLPIRTFNYSLSPTLPTGSLPNIIEKSFLNAWNIDSTGANNHIDIFPQIEFPNQNTLMIKLRTSKQIIRVFFYSMTVVYFQSVLPRSPLLTSETQPTVLTRYFIDFRESRAPGATLLSINSSLTMQDQNLLAGMKAFHARTFQTVNFLEFRTQLASDSSIQFPSLNTQSIEFMRFQLMVWYQKTCPTANPYHVVYLADCTTGCPAGYAVDIWQNCIADANLSLDYVLKIPDSNRIEMVFSVQPNQASYNNLYTLINWTNTISTDIQTLSSTIEYTTQPNPELKITLEYAQDLESEDRTITISPYDPTNYPINFKGFQSKTIQLQKLTSINNLAIVHYPDSAYQMAHVTSYLSIALSGLYMVTFLAGFAMGKVYILQMAFVPQVTLLSLFAIDKVSPTMKGLRFLKYVFGYSLTQLPSDLEIDHTSGQSQNYMAMMGVSTRFIYNYNLMFAFNIVAFVLFIVFYIKSRKAQQNDTESQQEQVPGIKAYHFFAFDTLLYLVLWFGLWIIFTGQIQISSMIKAQHESTLLEIMGIAFFSFNILLYLGYLVLYIKKIQLIEIFKQCLKDKNINDEQNPTQSKNRYFYVIYFIEKIIIASIFAFLNSFKFVNFIILGLHFILIILLIVLRPYKIEDIEKQSNSQNQSTIKPIIRPIINYLISIIIQILFFITNQFQSLDFSSYVPLIILSLLLLQLILTFFFLLKDRMIKKDIAYFKRLFMGFDQQKESDFSQVANQTPRKNTDLNQIKIELLKKNNDSHLGSKAKNQGYSNQKALQKIQQHSDQTSEKKNGQTKKIQVDYQNYFQQLNQPKAPRQNISIDRMLEIMAERNHLREIEQSKAESAAQMIQSAQKILEKVKKQKQILNIQNKSVKNNVKKQKETFPLKSQWQNLQVVDSSRMDKLIEFDRKRKEQSFINNL